MIRNKCLVLQIQDTYPVYIYIYSDNRTETSSPNDSIKKNECLTQDYLDSANTKEQNSQNEPDLKIAEVTSNGR